MGNQAKVPLIGNIMASRWAYEGLATNQFKNNKYQQLYFDIERQISNASYRENWADKIEEQLQEASGTINAPNTSPGTLKKVESFFKAEFKDLKTEYPKVPLTDIMNMDIITAKQSFLKTCKQNLDTASKYFHKELDDATSKKEHLEELLVQKLGSVDALRKFEHMHSNDRLKDIVTNSTDGKDKVIVTGNRVIRKYHPVFIQSKDVGLFSAPFYAYSKSFFGIQMETIWFNVIIIWLMTLMLYCILYFDVLRKFLER